MTCETIMLPEPETIGPKASLWDGVTMLADRGYRTLPIVADNLEYLGSLTRVHILSVMLPAAATIEGGLKDLGYVRHQGSSLRARLESERDRPVMEILDQFHVEVPRVHPDTAVMEGIRLLYKHGFGIPVVGTDNHLLGLITGHSALRALKELEP